MLLVVKIFCYYSTFFYPFGLFYSLCSYSHPLKHIHAGGTLEVKISHSRCSCWALRVRAAGCCYCAWCCVLQQTLGKKWTTQGCWISSQWMSMTQYLYRKSISQNYRSCSAWKTCSFIHWFLRMENYFFGLSNCWTDMSFLKFHVNCS